MKHEHHLDSVNLSLAIFKSFLYLMSAFCRSSFRSVCPENNDSGLRANISKCFVINVHTQIILKIDVAREGKN